MFIIKDNTRISIKSWCNNPEKGAIEQAINLANLPFAFHHIALMPDTHQGYGMPIGAILATEDIIVPNAVGVDIGCGMSAFKTSLSKLLIKDVEIIISNIKEIIPVGSAKLASPVEWDGFKDQPSNLILESGKYQLGTLGGGNHFIELQKDANDILWIMLHSGSRRLGYNIAKLYHGKAVSLCKRWYSDIPTLDLAFLPLSSREGKDYIEAMNFAIKYAVQNRYRMVSAIKEILSSFDPTISFGNMIDVSHNYAQMEHHFGKNVMVHRKGATSARKGEIGLIPGSQGTNSYVVRGLGNLESFTSCSHGAGRKMSRKKAKKILDLESQQLVLDNLSVVHSLKDLNDLDEAPGAYKDINIVMEEQKDLVEIVEKLTPLGVVKG